MDLCSGQKLGGAGGRQHGPDERHGSDQSRLAATDGQQSNNRNHRDQRVRQPQRNRHTQQNAARDQLRPTPRRRVAGLGIPDPFQRQRQAGHGEGGLHQVARPPGDVDQQDAGPGKRREGDHRIPAFADARQPSRQQPQRTHQAQDIEENHAALPPYAEERSRKQRIDQRFRVRNAGRCPLQDDRLAAGARPSRQPATIGRIEAQVQIERQALGHGDIGRFVSGYSCRRVS